MIMSLFRVNKPRGFQHTYIYYDPRKEKLRKIEEQAKRELGLLPPKEFSHEDIRGKFVGATTHVRRRKEKGGGVSNRTLICILIIMLAVFYYLIAY